MFLIVQVHKDKSGQTISHFIGIWARKVNYHRGKWTFSVRGYRTCEEGKEGKGARALPRGQQRAPLIQMQQASGGSSKNPTAS